MSTKTTNLEMTLLAEEDNFDTNVYNENFQKTDDKIGELNSMLGSEELTTTSQTHSGAINELNKNITNFSEQFTVVNLKRVFFDIDVANSYLAINFVVTDTLRFILTIEGNNKKFRLIKAENGATSTIFNVQGQ